MVAEEAGTNVTLRQRFLAALRAFPRSAAAFLSRAFFLRSRLCASRTSASAPLPMSRSSRGRRQPSAPDDSVLVLVATLGQLEAPLPCRVDRVQERGPHSRLL